MPSGILITGASGLIGTQLTRVLEANGHCVLRAVRRGTKSNHEVRWDPAVGEIDHAKLTNLDAVVHFAGANIGKRWTEAYKKEILDSRVNGTRLIGETIAKLDHKPRVFACASAIGYYGDRGSAELDESASPGKGFLPDVCLAWENACQPARNEGIRTVNMRSGVVLSKEGGALKSMLLPFKFGVAGVIGSGEQFMSWIAIDDEVRAIQFILENQLLSGPVNLVAPQPVTNREFTKTLGKVLCRPTFMSMPAFAARLAFGEMADEMLLSSTRVAPRKLLDAGFTFRYPQLESALRHVLGK